MDNKKIPEYGRRIIQNQKNLMMRVKRLERRSKRRKLNKKDDMATRLAKLIIAKRKAGTLKAYPLSAETKKSILECITVRKLDMSLDEIIKEEGEVDEPEVAYDDEPERPEWWNKMTDYEKKAHLDYELNEYIKERERLERDDPVLI